MQACARIGATHSVVFGGFSAQSLRDRIVDAGAVMVITADEQVRGGKQLPLKAIVDEALALGGCESVQQRHRLPAHRRQRRRGSRRATSGCTTQSQGQPDDLRARMGRRRASAVPALHLGLDRQAQGRAALDRRLPAARGADDEVDLRPASPTTSSGAPPTSAGSPATPTSPTARSRSARTEVVFEGVPTYPGRRPLLEDDPGPQGHASSTPRRRRSAR